MDDHGQSPAPDAGLLKCRMCGYTRTATESVRSFCCGRPMVSITPELVDVRAFPENLMEYENG